MHINNPYGWLCTYLAIYRHKRVLCQNIIFRNLLHFCYLVALYIIYAIVLEMVLVPIFHKRIWILFYYLYVYAFYSRFFRSLTWSRGNSIHRWHKSSSTVIELWTSPRTTWKLNLVREDDPKSILSYQKTVEWKFSQDFFLNKKD